SDRAEVGVVGRGHGLTFRLLSCSRTRIWSGSLPRNMNSVSAEGVVGPQLVVRGRLDGKGDLRVEGVFGGEIELQGKLTVGPGGTVVGPIDAGEIEVAGEVQGTVRARDGAVIRAGGRVAGDVRARRIAIDDGATLHGAIDMEFEVDGAFGESSSGERR